MELLQKIAGITQNDAILLTIVLIVGIVVVFPIVSASRQKRRAQYMEQQKLNQDMTKQMMGVIEKNTEAYTKLAVIIENTDKNCKDCKREQSDKMDRVLDGLNDLTRAVEILTTTNSNLCRVLTIEEVKEA